MRLRELELPEDMTPKQLEMLRKIEGLQDARECIDKRIADCVAALKEDATMVDFINTAEETTEAPKRHTMSEEGKQKVSEAVKKRWEKYRKEKNQKVHDAHRERGN